VRGCNFVCIDTVLLSKLRAMRDCHAHHVLARAPQFGRPQLGRARILLVRRLRRDAKGLVAAAAVL
jgi:hypothetical protein